MHWLRNQVEDWKYLISKDNTTSRGFYLFITVVFAALLLIFGFTFVVALLGKTTGFLRIVGFVGFPATILLIALIVALLSKD